MSFLSLPRRVLSGVNNTLSLARAYSTKAPPTWSSLPASKQKLIPTSGSYPKGFLVSGISSAVKKSGAKDLALITSPDLPCSAAAVFTKNVFQAAPVVASRTRLQDNGGKGIHGMVTNSGCANAVTGAQGLENAKEMLEALDDLTGHQRSSLVMSTGVIGQHLKMDKILKGIQDSKKALGGDHKHWMDCAEAYMTTDTFPKLRSKTFQLPDSGVEYRMAGITKGAGMIHPNMATLLGTIVTDLGVAPGLLQYALTHAVDRSFNAISVDGDMSTNDTVALLANGGASGGKIVVEDVTSKDFEAFRENLTEFAQELSQLVVRDGEGATKFVKVSVEGAPSFEAAKTVASTIATSSLVKTALYGQDANWGRILCAVGYSGVSEIDPKKVSVSFIPQDQSEPLKLLVNGEPEQVDEARASEILKMEDLEIRVELNLGEEKTAYWTCDLSHEYISINADYRS
ncbi:Arginine biosynthesis bifunctional protein ArgJ beta chain [Linnemannia elongata AG-77]|uniref:Arginine biosynthesis bifunctional protein ArgJ, mitochondrial n=1 Tax=Linnemannia elongata AG-77 TaxID=1314771 RepID=A0A197JZ09_9FUNG|nr:Arginine biosynthesis bifunctional protein ArgJ beta chain [Linnemannia elongata AG-77]